MPSDAEELPRRGEAGHGVVVALMRRKGMRMTSFYFFCRRGTWDGVGLCWPGDGGLLLDLSCWAAAAGKSR
jgi:hypothetical protein